MISIYYFVLSTIWNIHTPHGTFLERINAYYITYKELQSTIEFSLRESTCSSHNAPQSLSFPENHL